MPFKDGTYKHESGFVIFIKNGNVMVSPDHPLSLRIAEMFNAEKWKEIKEENE